eukprot:MONOS_1424.1-p1 / transcript=MONOS_1424.1 / gene=MONOS_1424 / organism=Monocercomonoides_exilis_PA203 / gene_product=unspecified product / transcript_product=unspecified product / location=Mono_scaffold00025:90638-95118(-) / protein_length=1346 / sequence_SO=supercontig / SO=protein_coding / is_pseudo=false
MPEGEIGNFKKRSFQASPSFSVNVAEFDKHKAEHEESYKNLLREIDTLMTSSHKNHSIGLGNAAERFSLGVSKDYDQLLQSQLNSEKRSSSNSRIQPKTDTFDHRKHERISNIWKSKPAERSHRNTKAKLPAIKAGMKHGKVRLEEEVAELAKTIEEAQKKRARAQNAFSMTLSSPLGAPSFSRIALSPSMPSPSPSPSPSFSKESSGDYSLSSSSVNSSPHMSIESMEEQVRLSCPVDRQATLLMKGQPGLEEADSEDVMEAFVLKTQWQRKKGGDTVERLMKQSEKEEQRLQKEAEAMREELIRIRRLQKEEEERKREEEERKLREEKEAKEQERLRISQLLGISIARPVSPMNVPSPLPSSEPSTFNCRVINRTSSTNSFSSPNVSQSTTSIPSLKLNTRPRPTESYCKTDRDRTRRGLATASLTERRESRKDYSTPNQTGMLGSSARRERLFSSDVISRNCYISPNEEEKAEWEDESSPLHPGFSFAPIVFSSLRSTYTAPSSFSSLTPRIHPSSNIFSSSTSFYTANKQFAPRLEQNFSDSMCSSSISPSSTVWNTSGYSPIFPVQNSNAFDSLTPNSNAFSGFRHPQIPPLRMSCTLPASASNRNSSTFRSSAIYAPSPRTAKEEASPHEKRRKEVLERYKKLTKKAETEREEKRKKWDIESQAKKMERDNAQRTSSPKSKGSRKVWLVQSPQQSSSTDCDFAYPATSSDSLSSPKTERSSFILSDASSTNHSEHTSQGSIEGDCTFSQHLPSLFSKDLLSPVARNSATLETPSQRNQKQRQLQQQQVAVTSVVLPMKRTQLRWNILVHAASRMFCLADQLKENRMQRSVKMMIRNVIQEMKEKDEALKLKQRRIKIIKAFCVISRAIGRFVLMFRTKERETSSKLIYNFLFETRVQMVFKLRMRTFHYLVMHAQKYIKNYVECTKARLRALDLMWYEMEGMLVQGTPFSLANPRHYPTIREDGPTLNTGLSLNSNSSSFSSSSFSQSIPDQLPISSSLNSLLSEQNVSQDIGSDAVQNLALDAPKNSSVVLPCSSGMVLIAEGDEQRANTILVDGCKSNNVDEAFEEDEIFSEGNSVHSKAPFSSSVPIEYRAEQIVRDFLNCVGFSMFPSLSTSNSTSSLSSASSLYSQNSNSASTNNLLQKSASSSTDTLPSLSAVSLKQSPSISTFIPISNRVKDIRCSQAEFEKVRENETRKKTMHQSRKKERPFLVPEGIRHRILKAKLREMRRLYIKEEEARKKDEIEKRMIIEEIRQKNKNQHNYFDIGEKENNNNLIGCSGRSNSELWKPSIFSEEEKEKMNFENISIKEQSIFKLFGKMRLLMKKFVLEGMLIIVQNGK